MLYSFFYCPGIYPLLIIACYLCFATWGTATAQPSTGYVMDLPKSPRSALTGRLYDGLSNTPIGDGYVFALSQDGNTILGYSKTLLGRGPDSGRWQITDLPASGKILLVGFHPVTKFNMAVQEVELKGYYQDIKVLSTDVALHKTGPSRLETETGEGGWLHLLVLAGWIAHEITTTNAEQETTSLADRLLASVKEERVTAVATKDFDRVTINAIEDASFPTLVLKVSVTDAAGRPVVGLGAEDFEVYESRRRVFPIAVVPIRSAAGYMDVVFVFDTTGSMREEIDGLKRSAIDFAGYLAGSGIDYRLGLVTFGDEIRSNEGFTTDAPTFREWISSLEAVEGGDTPENAFEALREAVRLDFRPEAQRILVLITDAPPHSADDVTFLRRDDVVVFLLAANVGLFITAPLEWDYGELVARVSGSLIPLREAGVDFSSVVRNMGQVLSNQYQISYTSLFASSPPSAQVIELVGLSTSGKVAATRLYSPESRLPVSTAPRGSGEGVVPAEEARQLMSQLNRNLRERFLEAEWKYLSEVSGTINQDRFTSWYPFDVAEGQSFVAIITWPGSALGLSVYNPRGEKVFEESSDKPPLQLKVDQPMGGRWFYRVQGVDVPHREYPFAGMVVARSSSYPAWATLFWIGLVLLAGGGAGALIYARLVSTGYLTPRAHWVLVGAKSKIHYRIGRKGLQIGRSRHSDIVLADEHVSRHHAQVVCRGGSLVVRDLKSANKTTVNGQPVAEKELKPGDEVGIAGHRFRVVWEGPARAKKPGQGRAR